MLASQQTNDERSESRADTPQLAAGSFIIPNIMNAILERDSLWTSIRMNLPLRRKLLNG